MALPGSPKQDRNGVRSALDLERKYDFSSLVGIKKAIKLNDEGLTKTNKILEEFIEATMGNIEDLQNQMDGKIETWFYEGVPTLENEPAIQWLENTYVEHQGDLYYDKLTGYAYRFLLEGNRYVWMKLSDSDVTEALAIANAASDTADSKRRVFTSVPVPPYDNGDLWIYNKEIYICQISKGNGEIYETKDFITATKYTDDTVANKVGEELTVVKGTVLTIKENYEMFKVEIVTTVTGMGSDLEVAKTSIEANTSEIDLRVRKDGIIGAINLTEEMAKIQAAKIELEGAVTMTALDSNLQDTISNYGAQLSVLNNQISAKIWQQDMKSAVDNIEIGGRNRLLNSAKWDDFTCPLGVTTHNTSVVSVVSGEVVTISYDVKATIECYGQSILVQYYDSSDVRKGYEWAKAEMTTNYTRQAVTVTIPDGISYISIGLRSNQNVEKTYRKLKVESGNKATDWTPAPEDVDNEITTLSTKYSELQMDLTGFKTTVAAEYTTLGEFKALDIGGTNILRYMNGYTEENKYVLTANKDNYNKLTPGRVQLEAGVEYTFSCKTDGLWLTGSSGDSVEAYLLLDGAYSTYFGLPTNPCTFTPTKSGLYTLRLDVNQNGATHSFWNIQIEKGNKATDWRQNLCDTEAEVMSIGTTATQTLEKFNWMVKSGTSSTNFTLSDRMAMLTAQVISLNANVQVSGDMIIAGAITGDKIAAGAITADKITVHDLSALGATIGGWIIGQSKLTGGNMQLDSSGSLSGGSVYKWTIDNTGIASFNRLVAKGADITGNISASSGSIGGFTVDGNSLYSQGWGTKGSVMVCTGTGGAKSIGGSDEISGWCFTAGANYGVTKNGVVYCSDLNVTGGKIKLGDATISSNGLVVSGSGGKSKLGCVNVDENSLFIGSWGGASRATPDVFVCKGSKTYQSLGGSGNINNWAFGAGSNFGVTADGDMYCKSGKIGKLYINSEGNLGGQGTNYMMLYPEGVTYNDNSNTFFIVVYKKGQRYKGLSLENGWVTL